MYAEQTIEQGWTRITLESQIKDNLFKRQAIDSVKSSNFLTRLPSPQSKLAHELLKQPYNFDFLGLHDDAHEREIEHASIEHITKFLLELGKGFAFVGRQIPIGLEESGYFIDMLFYHLKLHAYVVIEWKSVRFKPEHAGQLNFYLNLVDDFYKMPEDNPTIGLLLCKSRNKFEAEYALKGIEKPIGVSEYQLTRAIPENLKKSLPSIEEIEAELNELEDYDNIRISYEQTDKAPYFFVTQQGKSFYGEEGCGVASLLMLLQYINFTPLPSWKQLCEDLRLDTPPIQKGYSKTDPAI